MSIIIGISGKARSGKDTVADYIAKHHPLFKKTAFAESLKKACREIFLLTDEQLWGNQKGVVDPFWECTPREILQQVGTECLRKHFRDDVWIKSLEDRISCDYLYNYVISDIRFPNEAEAVKKWGGLVVLVHRPNRDEIEMRAQKHASEVSMDDYTGWDYTIRNDGSLEDLFQDVKDFLIWATRESHELVKSRTQASV